MDTLMSKSDRLVSLHKYHDYPKELVRYLLYNEDYYDNRYRDHVLPLIRDLDEYSLSDEDDHFYGEVLDECDEFDDEDVDDFDDYLDDEDSFDEEFENIRLA
jgi:hypothetical protein